jgi:ABC-type antimicrobial peptide transport system permease subunit
VVGVVADVLNNGPTGSRTLRPAHVYLPFVLADDDLTSAMTLTVRVADASSRVPDDLRQLAHAIGPRALVERIQSGEDLLGAGVATPRKRTVMLGLLGGLGLLHALVGIVGVTAHAVARRTREIGVRLAFGARPGQLVGAVIRDSSIPIVIGAVVGVGAAAFATRAIQSFLFETSPVEPSTLAVATGGLVLAGVLAATWPALRASRVDPVRSLRVE